VKKRTAIIATSAAVLIVGAALGSNDDSNDAKPAPAKSSAARTPAYKVVHQDDSGNQRYVTVEVTSTKGLRAVFDDIAGKLTEDAGYFVEINCSTGGTKGADNRLANGRKAVGTIGKASMGLDDGQTEYEANKGRTCPK
jgi:hypothetical protein